MEKFRDLKQVIDEYALESIADGGSAQVLDLEELKRWVAMDRYEAFELWYYKDGSVEPIVVVDAQYVIDKYMSRDAALTKEVRALSTDIDYRVKGFDFIAEWLEEHGYEIGEFGIDNTYNWRSDITVFEFIHFRKAMKDGLVIRWHKGGDVRGNYDRPEVWIGDVEGFFGEIQPMAEYEMAKVLGYLDFDDLVSDVEELIQEAKQTYMEEEDGLGEHRGGRVIEKIRAKRKKSGRSWISEAKKYYVGHPKDKKKKPIIFLADSTPTEAEYPEYGVITGPFKSKEDAENFVRKITTA